MANGPQALEPRQRDLLRRLARGERTEALADAEGSSPSAVLVDARNALVALDPSLAALVSRSDREAVADHLLGRGDAAEVLGRSADARRWALWLHEALQALEPDAVLQDVPGAGGHAAPPPTPAETASSDAPAGPATPDGPADPSAREAASAPAKPAPTAVPASTAATLAPSRDEERPETPTLDKRWLLGAAALGLALMLLGLALTKVDENVKAQAAFIERVPEDRAGARYQVVAVFDASARVDLERGQRAEMTLASGGSAVTGKVTGVEPRSLSRDTISERFTLQRADTKDLPRGRSAVALIAYDPADDSRSAADFNGRSVEVELRTGKRSALASVFG